MKSAAPEPAVPSSEETDDRPSKTSVATKAYVALAVCVVLALAGYFGYGWLTGNEVNTDDAQLEAEVVPLGTRVGGSVLHLLVKDNQTVKKGDLLAVVDPTDYETHVAEREADLAAALAAAETSGTRGKTNNQAAAVEAAKAALARTAAELHKAETDLSRARKLKAERAITSVEYENAQNTVDKARAAHDQADAQLRVAENSHGVAEAKVKSAEAALAQARAELGYTKISAPREGTLSKLAIEEGQIVQPGQMIAQLVDLHTYVVANFKETQIARIRPGQRAEIDVDAYPSQPLTGHVDSIAAATGARFSLLPPDNATGNYVKVVQRVPIKIILDDKLPPGVKLKAGLSADVTVYVQ